MSYVLVILGLMLAGGAIAYYYMGDEQTVSGWKASIMAAIGAAAAAVGQFLDRIAAMF